MCCSTSLFLWTSFYNQGWGIDDDTPLGLRIPPLGCSIFRNGKNEGEWVIQNEPVLSIEGVGVEQESHFGFALDTDVGTKVDSLGSASVSLTSSPLVAIPPALQVIVDVLQWLIKYSSGHIDRLLPNPGSAKNAPKNWGMPLTPAKHVNSGIKNPPQWVNECVPAACANSLEWLNRECNLGIPPEKLTVDHLKWVTKWIARGTLPDPIKVKKVVVNGETIMVAKFPSGTKSAWKLDGTQIPVPVGVHPDDSAFKPVWEHKRDEYNQWVVTDKLELKDAGNIGHLLDHDCDVEIEVGGHMAVVVGFIEVDNGYKLDVLHDEKQGGGINLLKGQVTERVCMDKTGKVTGNGWNHQLLYFVCECPRKPFAAKGDPHFMTWGGTWFDFHGECDLVLIHVPNFDAGLGLSIHVRTTIRYHYSYIETAAIKLGDDILEVLGYGCYALNGVEGANLDDAGARLGGFSIFHSNPNEKEHFFEILINNDEKITVHTFKDMVSVLVDDYSNSGRYDNSVGIMGSFGSCARLTRNGTMALDSPNDFGQEWQVHSDEPMLFGTVRAPQHPQKCFLPSNWAADNHRQLGETTVSQEDAEAACAHLETNKSRESCIADVLAIGDLDLAKAPIY